MRYVIFDAYMKAHEFVPGCNKAEAWNGYPKFCPNCGGKVEVKDEPKGRGKRP
jgi:NADH pyrophosphatase NudC (nudix superfamily)